jgi:hypothetical protein
MCGERRAHGARGTVTESINAWAMRACGWLGSERANPNLFNADFTTVIRGVSDVGPRLCYQSAKPPFVNLSVPDPTLALVAQHAVLTMIDAPCSCECSEHVLLGGDYSLPGPSGPRRGLAGLASGGLCSLQQGLPTAQINLVFQFSSCNLVSSSR